MNLSHAIDSLLLFVSRWAGVTLPRIMAALLGLIICILVLVRLWERRAHYVNTFIWGLFGVLLVGMALDTRILHGLGATSFLIRIRLLIGFMSVGVLLITLESVRRYRLQERYALVWVATAAVILICVCRPPVLAIVASIFGLEYVTAVTVVFLLFMILAAFHVSLALSAFQDDRTQLAQRCALLEARLRELERGWKAAGLPAAPPEPVVTLTPVTSACDPAPSLVRLLRGTQLVAPLVIVATVLAALAVGWMEPDVMVGDEVTHYHLLIHQAEVLPVPTYTASIPNGWGLPETRLYPHPQLWHYLGAVVYRWIPSARAVQFYHLLFLAQLLFVSFLLARDRGGVENRSAFLYMLVLATMPALLMFGILLYQDIPVTAQLVTAFYLISRRRLFGASVVMMVALGMKVSAFVMVPPFLVMVAMTAWRMPAGTDPRESGRRCKPWIRMAGWSLMSGLLLLATMGAIQGSLQRHVQGNYYPFEQLSRLVRNPFEPEALPPVAPDPAGMDAGAEPVDPGQIPRVFTSRAPDIEANHPGDLRDWRNGLIYGGVIVWPCLVLGLAGWCFGLSRGSKGPPLWSAWPLWVGLWYCAGTAFQLRSAPDARFFLPAVPFLLLPFVEQASRLPKFKLLASLLAAVAILQGARVLDTTYQLRRVSPALEEAITYLADHLPEPPRLFMYPEGNYRLFPCEHEWYLGYNLRNFWQADNTLRLRYLRQFKIGAIVIKKRLIAEPDAGYTNLGIYPVQFVHDIDADPRFEKWFDNSEVTIYGVPSLPQDPFPAN